MKTLDHIKNCKLLLIDQILKTNNNIKFFSIYDHKDVLKNIILKLKDENFFKALVLLNHQNYIGYFFQKNKLKLIYYLNKKEFLKAEEYLNDLLDYNVSNNDLLEIEILSLNILLEKIIIKGIDSNLLENLEEIKIGYFKFTEKKKGKFYHFKNKITLSNELTIDLYKILESIILNKFKFSINDLIFIKEYYQEEIEIVQNLNKIEY